LLPKATVPVRVRPDETVGASWRGVSLPFTRLYTGIDPRVEQILVGLGVNQTVLEGLKKSIAQQLTTKIAFEGMPIQDAIAFCKFIIDTTIGSAQYEIGVASCGGPVNIAVITRGGFEWVSKPKFALSTLQG
jgi:hypothetical protein